VNAGSSKDAAGETAQQLDGFDALISSKRAGNPPEVEQRSRIRCLGTNRTTDKLCAISLSVSELMPIVNKFFSLPRIENPTLAAKCVH
jgi:hypothetical protein